MGTTVQPKATVSPPPPSMDAGMGADHHSASSAALARSSAAAWRLSVQRCVPHDAETASESMAAMAGQTAPCLT
ncbi:hypothetical protein ACFYUR_22245 [Micromonospora haikouensis]|uniref:hypothetical protein n=1 Tax=Micromonospora haikouensis TaxID=686309 RepID=UPI003684D276